MQTACGSVRFPAHLPCPSSPPQPPLSPSSPLQPPPAAPAPPPSSSPSSLQPLQPPAPPASSSSSLQPFHPAFPKWRFVFVAVHGSRFTRFLRACGLRFGSLLFSCTVFFLELQVLACFLGAAGPAQRGVLRAPRRRRKPMSYVTCCNTTRVQQ